MNDESKRLAVLADAAAGCTGCPLHADATLQQCLDDAGIDRATVFMTNAVKHFKHERRGRIRLHKKPTTAEVEACHPWLDAELAAVPAGTIVALGATAVRGLLGKTMPIAAAAHATP